MSEDFVSIHEVKIASPCTASWEQMMGNEQVRFCDQCEKNVYNLSSMSPRQAEALIRQKEGQLCVRLYRRRDGTVLTDNCPVGFRAARRWLVARVGAVAAVFLAFFPGLNGTPTGRPTLWGEPGGTEGGLVLSPPPPLEPTMGEMMPPPEPPAPSEGWMMGGPPAMVSPEGPCVGRMLSTPPQSRASEMGDTR